MPISTMSASLSDCGVYTEMVALASRPIPLSRSHGSFPDLAIPELCLQKRGWEKEGLLS